MVVRRIATLLTGWPVPLTKVKFAAPASGARADVQFTDPDCAFDIKATLAGIGEVMWTGINLCGTKAVILNRNGKGVLWVDYE